MIKTVRDAHKALAVRVKVNKTMRFADAIQLFTIASIDINSAEAVEFF